MRAETQSDWLTVDQAADFMAMKPKALRSLIHRNQVPHYRTPTGRLRLNRDEIDAWIRGGADAA